MTKLDSLLMSITIVWALLFVVDYISVKRMDAPELRTLCPIVVKHFRANPFLMFAIAPGAIMGCGWEYK